MTDCHFCDQQGSTYDHLLKETENFSVVCDPYPLIEGHLLIIPKKHIPCMGSCGITEFREFTALYEEVSAFLQKHYHKVSSFEHGDIGQTIPHAHMHLLPCDVSEKTIVPEGGSHLEPLSSLSAIQSLFAQRSHYLFFSVQGNFWAVDSDLAKPRFFRDRLAIAVGHPKHANWKAMSSIPAHMKEAKEQIEHVEKKWKA